MLTLSLFSPTQVSARTESSIRKRNQAMPRTFSKRRSRFSSLWGLDTTSKRKTTGHRSINQASFRLRCRFSIAVCVLQFDPSVIYWSLLQVFVEGMEPAKKPLAHMFEDSASEKSVRTQSSLTPKQVWNGVLTLIITLLLLKLSMKQTVIAWHSQQCSSWRLIPRLCCLSDIPWK